MAAIDEKMTALAFTATSSKSPEKIAQLIRDAADIASASGGKITITQTSPGKYRGVLKNFVRVTHADFSVSVAKAPDGDHHVVRFATGDYLRVRHTVLSFIPVSPWQAPAYRPLAKFTEYVRGKL